MRPALIFVVLAPLAASAAEDDEPQDIVVTATRDKRSAIQTPASISRIDSKTIQDIDSKHQADVLNHNAGVYIQRGSGAESLAAIRSPVLSGAGACGAFLVAEDSQPIRPTGFCNLNEMFETNYEQARQIEVLRGPGSAMFGASAVHGVINVITPSVHSLPVFSGGLETGSDSFRRFSFATGVETEDTTRGFGAYGVYTRAPGWRDSSGVDEAKLNLLGDLDVGGGQLRLRAAGTVLNQETAGFITGYESYLDEDLARTNPNPESFRDASSARASAHFEKTDVFGERSNFELAGIYRRSRMDFLQHFLIGKPLEHNAQTSFMVSSSVTRPFGALQARLAIDGEMASSELVEYQQFVATDGSPPANAIRPQGFHYDYTVDSWTLGATLALEYPFTPELRATAALRADSTNYDYDNHMIDGNANADGIPCLGGGCLFSRPADRSDRFGNLSPSFTLSWKPVSNQLLYLNLATGFRPPETTELYRLQRQQLAANLDSENLDSVEVGWKFSGARYSATTALYAMRKDHLILRETNGFNVGDGSTRHRGIEYEFRRDGDHTSISLNGTYARHQYAFTRSVEGGETIVDGNDVDTAPRNLHSLSFELDIGSLIGYDGLRAAVDANYVGKYYLDAANTATYTGHTVANGRILWRPAGGFNIGLRVDNLFDKRYADRADFAFGNYRYFPARGRAVFLSLDYARN